MKKIIFELLMLCVLLYGCGNTTFDNDKSKIELDNGMFEKTQQIEVQRADTSEVIKTITSKEDIKEFVSQFDLEYMEASILPEGSTEKLVFNLLQEETIKLDEKDTDGTLYEIATLTTYQNTPCVTLKIAGVSMSFQLSNDAEQYLNGFIE